MKNLAHILILGSLAACSHQARTLASHHGTVAEDSLAGGNVRALATRSADSKTVCFDIELRMTGTPQEQSAPANWTASWVDQQGKQHPLSLQQRDPASKPEGGMTVVPYGAYEQWTNTFRTCTRGTELADVKAIQLTPKQLAYGFDQALELSWK